MPRNDSGYSIYELLLTLVLIGILASLGLPAFSTTLAKSRQTSEINALFHAVHLARKESIRRREVMTVCASTDGLSCGSAQGVVVPRQPSPPREASAV